MWRSSFSQVSKKGWVDLFDGKLLNGWTNPYDHGESTVVDGEIHLVSNDKFFLVTEKAYSDFISACPCMSEAVTGEVGVWGSDDYYLGRSLDVFISRLRKYLKSDPDIKIINLHGIGFRFNAPIEKR